MLLAVSSIFGDARRTNLEDLAVIPDSPSELAQSQTARAGPVTPQASSLPEKLDQNVVVTEADEQPPVVRDLEAAEPAVTVPCLRQLADSSIPYEQRDSQSPDKEALQAQPADHHIGPPHTCQPAEFDIDVDAPPSGQSTSGQAAEFGCSALLSQTWIALRLDIQASGKDPMSKCPLLLLVLTISFPRVLAKHSQHKVVILL